MREELNTELFRAIKSLNIKNLNNADKNDLLNIFNHTKNDAIRDTIALIYAETKYNEAIPFIIEKIRDKAIFNHTGTLVYCLQELDSKNYLIDMIKIMCEQAYESKITAYSIIIKSIQEITNDDRVQALDFLNNYKKSLTKSNTEEDTVDLINSVIHLLEA